MSGRLIEYIGNIYILHYKLQSLLTVTPILENLPSISGTLRFPT